MGHCLLIFWSLGLLVSWSLGLLVSWSLGLLVSFIQAARMPYLLALQIWLDLGEMDVSSSRTGVTSRYGWTVGFMQMTLN